MAVFVIGTSPLFTLIGYAAHKAATAWRGRLAAATGLIVVALGLYTLNGGLTLVGSPLAARNLSETIGLSRAAATPDESTVTVDAKGRQTAVVTVRSGSYSPANIEVKPGVATTLVFRSEGAQGCVRAVVLPALNQQVILPEKGDTPVDLGVLRSGRLEYSCAMGMYTGAITIV